MTGMLKVSMREIVKMYMNEDAQRHGNNRCRFGIYENVY
jgi:hypothetical protein